MATDRYYRKYIVDAGRKDLQANLKYRKLIRAEAAKSGKFRDAQLAICSEDILYWMNLYCFVYEPRPRYDSHGKRLPKTIPMITWPHQDPIIADMVQFLGTRDLVVNKSRGEGLSWMALLKALHEFLFDPDGTKIGLISSKMEKSHKSGDLDSLLAKVVWEMEKLPEWMTGPQAYRITEPGDWQYASSDNALINRKNGSQVVAYAASGNAPRGGRYTWFLCDELGEWEEHDAVALMDASNSATDSRMVISTPAGPTGMYYRFVHAESNAVKLESHWSQNISKNRGLYIMVKGKPSAIDPLNNPLPPEYNPPNQDVQAMFARLRNKGFDLKVGRRSPWYDTQCDKADSTPTSIAKELDLNFGGSIDKVFHSDFFEVAEKHVRPATIRGQFYANPEGTDWDFERSSDGQFHLWCELDVKNMPPRGEYGVSCDLAVGGGGAASSNSALEVIDFLTNEQVLEYATNVVSPEDFADVAIGICHWFYGAYLSWEHQGPGTAFGTRIKTRGYGNIFERKVPWKGTQTKLVREPGWITTINTKPALFEGIRAAVKRRELIIHSKQLIDELHQYIYVQGGKIEHAAQPTATGSQAGAQHGDRVIAIGVGVQAAKDRPQAIRRRDDWTPDGPPPVGTLAWREWYAGQQEQPTDDWDDRSTYELARPRTA